MRPSGREASLQPHLGLARTATWLPSSGATITTEHVELGRRHGVDARSLRDLARHQHAALAAELGGRLRTSGGVFVCWRGNAAGLGGWTYMQRFLLSALQPTGMGFFGLYGSTGALATTLALAAVTHRIGIGLQRGAHANWQLVHVPSSPTSAQAFQSTASPTC